MSWHIVNRLSKFYFGTQAGGQAEAAEEACGHQTLSDSFGRISRLGVDRLGRLCILDVMTMAVLTAGLLHLCTC